MWRTSAETAIAGGEGSAGRIEPRAQALSAIMHIIIGMPPHIIIMGIPAPIMVCMRMQA